MKDGKLIGIDPVPRMIEIAENLAKEYHIEDLIVFKIGSAENLPLDDSIAELVFGFDSIDHWQDIHKGLKEILRILKPGGRFIIVKDLSLTGQTRCSSPSRKNWMLQVFYLKVRNLSKKMRCVLLFGYVSGNHELQLGFQ